MSEWQPLPDEDPKSYVERVGGRDGANVKMTGVLKSHFGFSDGDAKELGLTSSTFWMNFYRTTLEEMHARGSKREAAVRFIEKRNDDWGIGKPTLTPAEVEALLDEYGDWNP